jgi:acyl-CoA hydrolase
VPLIEGPVTSFQHSSVVTEYGLAQIFGNEEHEQVRQLIEHAAHPDARDALWEAAKAQGRG